MKILNYLKKVKSSIQNLPENILIYKECLSEFLYLMSLEKSSFEEVTSERGYTYHRLKLFNGESPQNKCSFSVPAGVAVEPKAKKKQPRTKKNYEKIYSDLFKSNIDFRKDYSALKEAFCRYVQSWKWLKKEFDGVYRAFLVSEKGTPNYSRKMYWRIHDYAKLCDKKYKHCYFVTLTMAQREYKGNLQAAWKVFNSAIGYYAKNINRKLEGAYIIAMEAHQSGFPHAHAVFYTNKELNNPPEKWDFKKKATCLCSGEMFDLDKKFWKLGYTVVKVNSRESTDNYLAKYLNKGNVEYFLTLAKKEKWNATDIKDVATLFLPKIYGIREFRLSQNKFEKEESLQEMCLSESLTSTENTTAPRTEELTEDCGRELEEFRTLLKALWNKSPLNCSQKLFICSQKDFELKKLQNPMLLEKLPHATNHYLGEMGNKISCSGCILSEIDNFIWNGSLKIFTECKNYEYFLEFFEPYAETEKEELIKARFLPLGKKERERFETMLYYSFSKLVAKSEVYNFAKAIYLTNPLLFRFILPPKWQPLANSFRSDYSEVLEKFDNTQLVRIRSFLKEYFSK